ncbi:MAG: DUF945 family protein [Campylobacteraceae bacterium]|jgi:hypothetical protein|nr:DUF945 family protein [Campylobacteraceae bacterium]
MKKIILFLAGIAVAAALYFCFSAAYANYQVHKYFTSEAGYFDRFGIKYELIERQRGLFSSIYKTKLSMIISRDTVLEAVIESKAKFGIRDLNIFKIGRISVNYEYSDNIKNILGEDIFNYLVISSDNITFDIGYKGIAGKTAIKPQSFTYSIDLMDAFGLESSEKIDFTYNLGAVLQEMKVSFDSRNIILKQHIEEMTQSNTLNQTTKLEDVDYDIALNKNDIGTWLGFIKATAKKYDFHIESFDSSFADYTVSASIEEQNDGLLSVNFKNGAGEFILESNELNLTIKDFLADITVSRLEQNTIGDVVNKLSKINLDMGNNEQKLILASAAADATLLLKSQPMISFNLAGSYNNSKTNEISAYIQYIGENAYGMNIFNLKNYFDFELKYSIDKKMLVSLLQKYERDREKRGYSLSDEEIEQISEDYLSKLQEIGADISGDMITGTINKNTNFNSF